MSSEIAVKVENLSKCYHIYDTPRDRLKQFILPRAQRLLGMAYRQYYREHWALRDVSFEVKKGETVGIIGRNGSGKSTLLQMICGTLNPTLGSVTTNGRIAALLELGSGFNPDFSGRENVYMSASILGLTKEEIDGRYDDVVAFADIGQFIEQPVKTYSSGMFVRLAFAVNIMSRPEIMVVDEALAVGDMAFQAKCMTALRRIQDAGATVLFVSHDIGSIKSLCSHAAYIENGLLKDFGKAANVAENYVRIVREEMNAQGLENAGPRTERSISEPENHVLQSDQGPEFKTSAEFDLSAALFRYGLGGGKIRYAELIDLADQPIVSAEFNQKVKIRIYFEMQEEADVSVNYYIQDDKKNQILGAGLRTAGGELLHCLPGSRHVVTYTTNLPLQEGNYSIELQLARPVVQDQTAEFLDVIDNAIVFSIQRKTNGRLWAKVYLDNVVEVRSA